jgi:superfamily II DNA or RNA helicase
VSREDVLDLAAEMSLREPQRKSLERLDAILADLGEPIRGRPIGEWETAALEEVQPFALDQDDYPSFAFQLATAVGKTRLIGANILYLHRTQAINTFLVVAPNRTVYRKLKDDFTAGTPKFVFAGVTRVPEYDLITGENYMVSNPDGRIEDPERMVICVFNIQKLLVGRGQAKTFLFRTASEDLGQPFADILGARHDLVVMMDESHHYRGTASAQAISSLRPLLGLETTATPRTDNNKPFRNVIYRYDLRRGIAESRAASAAIAEGKPTDRGYMKIPVAVARADDHSVSVDIEENKLLDGLNRHLQKKARLSEWCAAHALPPFLPLALITAPNIGEADRLFDHINSDDFMAGTFKDRVINVNTGLKASDYETQVERLVALEGPGNTYEVVIHVEQLKEGWDVRSVYTIIPFRASVSMNLVEQTIGRGLRLPFGRLTGDHDLDRLEVISHERFSTLLADAGQDPIAEIEKTTFGTPNAEPAYAAITFAPRDNREGFPPVPRLRYMAITDAARSADDALRGFRPKPTFGDLQDIQAHQIEQDLLTGEERHLGDILRGPDFHPVWHLVRLLDRVAEIDLETDKDGLGRIITDYLTALTGTSDQAAWVEPADDYDGLITDDIARQLAAHIGSTVVFDYTDTDTFVEWAPFTKSLPVGAAPLPLTSRKPVSRHVFDGYTKSLYPILAFDSAQEREFAALVERDPAVATFVRLPINRFPVHLRTGNYNPDFLVFMKDETALIVEIKERPKIEDHNSDVAEKARAAEIWCAAATRLGHGQWAYRLYAHDEIGHASSVAAIPPAKIR